MIKNHFQVLKLALLSLSTVETVSSLYYSVRFTFAFVTSDKNNINNVKSALLIESESGVLCVVW